jgi:hypothetical protein
MVSFLKRLLLHNSIERICFYLNKISGKFGRKDYGGDGIDRNWRVGESENEGFRELNQRIGESKNQRIGFALLEGLGKNACMKTVHGFHYKKSGILKRCVMINWLRCR